MARNQFQDIKKIKKIKMDKNPNEFSAPVITKIHNDNFENKIKVINDPHHTPRYTLWVVALISIVFLFFALSFLFSSATVTINPKIKILSLNQNIHAVKDPNTDQLAYDLVALSDSDSKTISAGQVKDYNEKAKGKVLLYNKVSSASQTIAIDTRLEGSNGKIYKTTTKIEIPGMNKDGTPGKVSVDIYASSEGAEYNSTPLDFKILGYKGTSKYTKIYGRSVGDITGGLQGMSRQISDIEKTNTAKELKNNLQNKLYNKVISQIPEGFILFKEAVFLTVDDTTLSDVSEDGSVTMTITGTLYGFIFNENKLTKKIVQDLIPDYDNSIVYISNIKDLTFAITNKENIIFADATSIDFNIYGVPKIVYKFDQTNLTSELAGKKKEYLQQILVEEYPNVESANLSIKPIWRSMFPEKVKNIKTIINYPK